MRIQNEKLGFVPTLKAGTDLTRCMCTHCCVELGIKV